MKRLIWFASIILGCCWAQASIGADLFESDWASGKINEFSPTGAETTFASGLSAPSGLAFNASGDLFEADEGSGNIYEFTPSGVRSTFATGLGQPYGLAFAPNGNLLVSDLRPLDMYSITPQGAVSVFPTTGLLDPLGVAFGANGNLFIGDLYSIIMITPGGTESNFGNGEGEGLAFGLNGNLYSSSDSSAVYVTAPSGVQTTFATIPGRSGALAVDSSGNLFVGSRGATEIGTGAIYEISPTGVRSTFATGLSDPQGGLAFSPVPEPSSVVLFILGAAGFFSTARRRR